MTTLKGISELLHIAKRTIESFLYRYNIDSSRALMAMYFRKPPPGRTRSLIGTIDIEEKLKSSKMLVKWAHYSLRERVQKVFTTFGVKVSIDRLWRFYKMHDIKFRTTKYAFRNEFRDKE